MTRLNFENLNIFQPTQTAGEYDIPIINGVDKDFELTQIIDFNKAKKTNVENATIHFFLSDNQFTCVWNKPDKYTQMIKRAKCVCAPDFSIYTDMPKALQVYNHYRKHWLVAYWEELGASVLPCITWGGEETFSFCYTGEPKKQTCNN